MGRVFSPLLVLGQTLTSTLHDDHHTNQLAMSQALELLSPCQMGSLFLKNRVVLAPLTRGRAGQSRLPNSFMRDYYEMRASAGLIIAEATAISDSGFGYYGAPACYTSDHAAEWKHVVDAVHAKDGKIFLQMWHMGRAAHSSYHQTNEIVAPSAIPIPAGTLRDCNQNVVPFETPRALTVDEITVITQDYARCADFAKQAGFDGVEIHAANGYLLDEFFQICSNHRDDQYGGSVENRFRILGEVLQSVGNVYPFDRIGVRLSPNGTHGGMGSPNNFETFIYIAQRLNNYGLAYLHVMDGLGFGWHNLDKQVRLVDIKRVFFGTVIGNCGYTRDTAEGAIRSGAADFIAFGRLYLSNPDLVERFANDWPLNPIPPRDDWFGRAPDPSKTLNGYLTYLPYSQG
jgi:N-ethylmaleimide reductase